MQTIFNIIKTQKSGKPEWYHHLVCALHIVLLSRWNYLGFIQMIMVECWRVDKVHQLTINAPALVHVTYT